MTREEEIYKKAEGDCIALLNAIEEGAVTKGSICPQSYRSGFMDGARWADNTIINKAFNYILENFEDIGLQWLRGASAKDVAETFRKSMEE